MSASCRVDTCPNLTWPPYNLEATYLGQLAHMVPDSMPSADACRTILAGRLVVTVDGFHVVSDQKAGPVLHISADADFSTLRTVLCDYFESTLGKNWEMVCVEVSGSGGGGESDKSSACVRLLRSCKSESSKTLNGTGRPPKPEKSNKINVLLAPISRRIVSGTTRQSHSPCPAAATAAATNGVTIDEKAKKKKVLKRVVKQPPSISSVSSPSAVLSPTSAVTPVKIDEMTTKGINENDHLPLVNDHAAKPNSSSSPVHTSASSSNCTLISKMTAIFGGRRNSRDATPTDNGVTTVSAAATVAAATVIATGPNITVTPAENIGTKLLNGSVIVSKPPAVKVNGAVGPSTSIKVTNGVSEYVDQKIKPKEHSHTPEPDNEVRKMSVSDVLNKLHKIDKNNNNISNGSDNHCHSDADGKSETVNDNIPHINSNGIDNSLACGTIIRKRESYYKDDKDQHNNSNGSLTHISSNGNYCNGDGIYSNGNSIVDTSSDFSLKLAESTIDSTATDYDKVRRSSLDASPLELSSKENGSSLEAHQRSFSLSSRSAEIMRSYAASRGEARSLPPVPTRPSRLSASTAAAQRQRRRILSPISSGGSSALSSSSLTEEDEDEDLDVDEDDVTLSSATAPASRRDHWAARLRAAGLDDEEEDSGALSLRDDISNVSAVFARTFIRPKVEDTSLSLSASTSTLKAAGGSSSRLNVEQSQKVAVTVSSCAGDMVRGMANDMPVIVLQQVLAHFSNHELCELRLVHPHWDELCGQMLNSAYYQLIHAADRLLTDCQRKVHLEKYLAKPIQILTNLQVHVINPVDVLRAAIDEGVVCFPYGLLLDKAFELLDRVEFVIRQKEEVGDALLNWERLAEYARRAQTHYRKFIEPEAERRMAEVYKLSAAQRLQRIDSFLVEASVTKLEKDTEKAKDDMRWELEQLKTQNQQLKKDNRELKQTCLKLDGRIDALERKFKTMARLLQ